MADYVTIRHPEGTAGYPERTVPKTSLPFFVNQGYQVLDSKGHVSGSATAAAATSTDKKKDN